jgi:hypothetical protein
MTDRGRPLVYSSKIVGAELPREGKPILISDYKVIDRGYRDYSIDLSGLRNPFVQVNQSIGGKLSPDLAKLLGVDVGTYLCTGSDAKFWEGLRTVHFYVKDRAKPTLDLARDPTSGPYYWKYLFGSVKEGDGRIGIPGVSCYVVPHVWEGTKDWFETALSTYGGDLSILSAPDVSATLNFVYLKNLDNDWLESEYRRFRGYGERLSRDEIAEKFRSLQSDLEPSVIRTRELLAWPIESEE